MRLMKVSSVSNEAADSDIRALIENGVKMDKHIIKQLYKA